MGNNIQITKKQHFIPQCYLKHFSEDEAYVYVFNKENQYYCRSRISDIAEQNKFYDLALFTEYDTLDDDLKLKIDAACVKDYGKPYCQFSDEEKIKCDQSVEKYMGVFETSFGYMIKKIIDNTFDFNSWVARECNFINEKEKYEMAYLIAVQYVRTKSFRDFITNSKVNMMKQTASLIAKLNGVDVEAKEINVKYSKEESKMDHISAILNDEFISKISNIFCCKKWVLYENKTELPFVACDSLLIILNKKSDGLFNYGLQSPDCIIEFPLTNNLLIIMYDPLTFSKFKDLSIVSLENIDFINDINEAALYNADQFVYAKNLKLVDELKNSCLSHPTLTKKRIKRLISGREEKLGI